MLFSVNGISEFVNNHPTVKMLALSGAIDADKLFTIKGYLNATTGTPTWSDVSAANSVIETSTAGDYTSGGKLVFTLSVAPSGSEFFDLTPVDTFLAPGDVLTLVGYIGTGGAGGDISLSATWREDF